MKTDTSDIMRKERVRGKGCKRGGKDVTRRGRESTRQQEGTTIGTGRRDE